MSVVGVVSVVLVAVVSAAVIGFKHDVRMILAASFVALFVSALHADRVKPGTFFALVRELLSLAHCAACGANGEAGPKGERRRRESRK